LLAQRASTSEIAEQLVIANNTVKRHVSSILGKLGASNRIQAVAQARELGFLWIPNSTFVSLLPLRNGPHE
jgi:DNA-binding NarL/FixJ family response regulator